MIRERLPITPFDKAKAIILENNPHFFDKQNAFLTSDGWQVLYKKTLPNNFKMNQGKGDDSFKQLKTAFFFNYHGKKIFSFSENITKELFLTEIGNVSDEFIKLPFPVIVFHFPALQISSLIGKESPINYFYLGIEQLNEHEKQLSVFCVPLPSVKFAVSYGYKFIFRGGKIKDQLKVDRTMSSQMADQAIALTNLLFAALLYINSSDADFTPIVPRVIFPKQDSSIPVCAVGRNIIINKDYVTPKGEIESHEHIMHVLKWSVRGHFRNQYCGEGKARKPTWIRPYLKGKERLNETVKTKPIASYIVK